MTENMPSSRKIIKLLNLYFKGIFFAPVRLEDEGIHMPDKKLPIEKEQVAPYIKEDGSFNLKQMSAEAPFNFFFPIEIRKEEKNDDFWALREQLIIKNNNKTGGFIRTFIEDLDNAFIKRLDEQIPERNIKRNEDFSIPNDFFTNLTDNNVYAAYKERIDENGKKSNYLQWDFLAMRPPLAHILEKHTRRKSIYRTYEWYAERKYTTLIHGAGIYKDKEDIYELMEFGKNYCIKEIFKSYQIIHPDKKNLNETLLLIIYKMLETPHAGNKTIEELTRMFSGELKLRKGKPLAPLSKKDVRDIKNAAKKIRSWISGEDQVILDRKIKNSIIDTAFEVLKHQKILQIKNNDSLTDTIKAICNKIEIHKSLKRGMNDKDASQLEEENIVTDKGKTKYYNLLFYNTFNEIFNKEEENNFVSFIQKLSFQEISELLLPYTTSSPNINSELYKKYCNTMELTFNYDEDRRKAHTRFAKKIRQVFDIIRENPYKEIN